MAKWRKGPGTDESHVETSQLMLFVDGQLRGSESAAVQAHLETCWSCRADLAKVQDAIAAYVDYRKHAYSEELTPPPNAWRDFESRLRDYEREFENARSAPSVFRRLARFAGFGTGLQRIQVPIFASVIAAVIGVSALLYFTFSSRPSASEILRRTTAAEAISVRSIPQPVIYQKLRVHLVGKASNAAAPVTVELWKDLQNGRLRESTEHWSRVAAVQPKPVADEPSPLHEIEEVYAENQLSTDSPLSTEAFAAWSNSVPDKRESVEALRADGEAAYRVTTRISDSVHGSIREMDLVVRARDWHAISERLIVAADPEPQTYEIAELDYRVVPLSSLRADMFIEPANQPSLGSPLRTSSFPELQIEALDRLDRVDALVQDQLNISHTTDGALEIQGVVPTRERKSQIIASLGELADNPAIKLEIRGADDAVNRKKQRSFEEVEGQSVVLVNTTGNPDLRQYLVVQKHLSDAGLEEAMQQFANSAVDHSVQAQLDSLALKQILNAFPALDSESINAKARQRWRALIARRVLAAHQQIAALRDQLTPVFFPGDAATGRSQQDASQMDDLKAMVEKLCASTNANDKVLWKALSPGADDAARGALKKPAFRESLSADERLAEAILRKMHE